MASWSHQVEYINNLHEDNDLCFSHTLSEAFGKHLQAFSKHIQRRQWQPTPVLLPGKSHGWRSLVGCGLGGLWGRTESDWLKSDWLCTEWLKQLRSSKSKHILNLLKESRDTHHFHLSVSACLTSVETTDISNDPDFLVERENVVR